VLTDKGESFSRGRGMRQWGEQHLFAQGERHSLLVDRRTGKPVPFMVPAAQDGTACCRGYGSAES
jgi:acyl-CoA thioesterase FadM